MAGAGIRVKDSKEIKVLASLGLKNRQIAKALNIQRNTVNKYVRDPSKAAILVSASGPKPAINWEKVRKLAAAGDLPYSKSREPNY